MSEPEREPAELAWYAWILCHAGNDREYEMMLRDQQGQAEFIAGYLAGHADARGPALPRARRSFLAVCAVAFAGAFASLVGILVGARINREEVIIWLVALLGWIAFSVYVSRET